MMKKIGVGIIGLGRNGGAFVRCYRDNPKAEVLAVCDLSEEKCRAIKDKYQIPDAYQDYNEMLERSDINLISIHTPDHLHAKPFVDSLKKHKHVFVEKPMADSIGDLRRMIEASRESAQKVIVGQILRFNPLFRKIKEIVDSGQIGEIFYMEGDYIHNLRGQAESERYNPEIRMNWYLEKELPMVGGGCHPLDLLRWFSGKEVVEVQAFSNRIAFPEMKNDDCIVAIFKFKNDIVAKVTVLYSPVAPYAYANNIAVYGTKGTIIKDMICLGEEKGFAKIKANYSGEHPYEPEVNHFIDCILEDKPTLVNAMDGARSAAAVIIAEEALKMKKAVPVPVL